MLLQRRVAQHPTFSVRSLVLLRDQELMRTPTLAADSPSLSELVARLGQQVIRQFVVVHRG